MHLCNYSVTRPGSRPGDLCNDSVTRSESRPGDLCNDSVTRPGSRPGDLCNDSVTRPGSRPGEKRANTACGCSVGKVICFVNQQEITVGFCVHFHELESSSKSSPCTPQGGLTSSLSAVLSHTD